MEETSPASPRRPYRSSFPTVSSVGDLVDMEDVGPGVAAGTGRGGVIGVGGAGGGGGVEAGAGGGGNSASFHGVTKDILHEVIRSTTIV